MVRISMPPTLRPHALPLSHGERGGVCSASRGRFQGMVDAVNAIMMQPTRCARRSFTVKAVALGVCVLLLTGCSSPAGDKVDAGSVPTAAATPDEAAVDALISPPSGYLRDTSGTPVEGFTGTYCWQQGRAGSCSDYSPWNTNKTAIELQAGQALDLVFDAGLPRDTKVRWLAVEGLLPRDLGDGFEWTPADDKPVPLSGDLRAPATAGRYALEVFALFPQGDVTYGFYVEAR